MQSLAKYISNIGINFWNKKIDLTDQKIFLDA